MVAINDLKLRMLMVAIDAIALTSTAMLLLGTLMEKDGWKSITDLLDSLFGWCIGALIFQGFCVLLKLRFARCKNRHRHMERA